MRLRFLGTDSDRTGCPAMYATDRGTYAVQGTLVTNPEALGDAAQAVALASDEAIVEIEPALVRHLIEHYQEHHGG